LSVVTATELPLKEASPPIVEVTRKAEVMVAPSLTVVTVDSKVVMVALVAVVTVLPPVVRVSVVGTVVTPAVPVPALTTPLKPERTVVIVLVVPSLTVLYVRVVIADWPPLPPVDEDEPEELESLAESLAEEELEDEELESLADEEPDAVAEAPLAPEAEQKAVPEAEAAAADFPDGSSQYSVAQAPRPTKN